MHSRRSNTFQSNDFHFGTNIFYEKKTPSPLASQNIHLIQKLNDDLDQELDQLEVIVAKVGRSGQ